MLLSKILVCIIFLVLLKKKKKHASPITLTFCELNSRRFISWSLIKLVLSQIFIFSFHNLSSNICPSRTPVPLMLFSELHVNVFVLDYFSPEVIVFIFSSQKIMLLSVLELYIFLINDWNVSRLRMLCNSNNVFIFSCRSGLKTCVLANTRTKFFFFLVWVGVCFKCYLFTALLVLHS